MKSNVPARVMLSYLVHFFDFAPFLRMRTGTFVKPPDSASFDGGDGGGDGDGEYEEDKMVHALVYSSPAWGWPP